MCSAEYIEFPYICYIKLNLFIRMLAILHPTTKKSSCSLASCNICNQRDFVARTTMTRETYFYTQLAAAIIDLTLV